MPSKALATEGKRQRIGEKRVFYTYILRSILPPEQRYIGSTADLKSREKSNVYNNILFAFSKNMCYIIPNNSYND